jgi:glycosyltransferase involved in cell wall biosynthesis
MKKSSEKSNNIYLSLVIPLYNESERIGQAVGSLSRFLLKQDFTHEVIFVDDGSRDDTIIKLISLKPKFNYLTLGYKINRGKGYALKQGMKKARGSYVIFLDVDMSTPIEELRKFRPWMDGEYHIIIGTRKAHGARLVKRQPILRQKMGEIFTALSNLAIGGGVTDFTCGFKCFSQEAARKIWNAETINRWGFDTEIIFLARKFGYSVTELPVVWSNDERTRVNLLKDSLRSLSDLFKIRYNSFRGVYDKKNRRH